MAPLRLGTSSLCHSAPCPTLLRPRRHLASPLPRCAPSSALPRRRPRPVPSHPGAPQPCPQCSTSAPSYPAVDGALASPPPPVPLGHFTFELPPSCIFRFLRPPPQPDLLLDHYFAVLAA
ncbi:hypothetical protein BS78_03G144800 [Paspalum vaginatum]|nr:hypothetical protein BS78_03G144800 [Paspalum vaginatum]